MRRIVNGVEEDLLDLGLEIESLPDRLVVRGEHGAFTALVAGSPDKVLVSFKGRQYTVERPRRIRKDHADASSGELKAHMPGIVVDIHVKKGSEILKGETVLILEAMKTQQPLLAPFDSTVVEIPVNAGDSVVEGTVLAILKSRADN